MLVADASAGGGKLVVNGHAVGASCPDRDLGSLTGAAVAQGSNAAAPTRFIASCAGLARDTTLMWTAPTAGEYVFDTEGSSFDTILALHAGRCSEQELACNDDVGSGNLQSRITRTFAAGEVVTIVVGGFRGRSGDWTLRIAPR